MELEVVQHLGAEKYDRVVKRTGGRNGYRDRNWTPLAASSNCVFLVFVMVAITRRCSSRTAAVSVPW